MRWWHTIQQLRNKGVLGLNARNALYLLPHNQRELYPLVDDKLRTKQLAQAAGIAVPPLYAVISTPREAKKIHDTLAAWSDFVIKPAHGSGGDGILVVTGRTRKGYRLSNGATLLPEDMEFHIQSALSGIFSLGGQPDRVLVEYRVQLDPLFEGITFYGVPDMRIIVYRGVPVMAMVRLPTRQSLGRANLHQGAVGVGVDLASGRMLQGVLHHQVIDEHPDTGNPLGSLIVPHWERLLELGARSLELTGLGYQGIDIVLDRNLGPLILELNARPGLTIQIANQAGLDPRLQEVDRHRENLAAATPQERARFARERFGVTQSI
ncbi:MAG: alpha-L-glutamate ligase-like protein [Magnetococcales bacterium]|nr:alpha-L-glutamate ligase-like protein [Magnetococcales bacterium]